MKKTLLISVVAAALMAFTYGEWYSYSSQKYHFSANFPGKPTETSQQDTISPGVYVTSFMAEYSVSDNEVYMASYTDLGSSFPKDKTMQQMLENSRDGAAGAMNAADVTTLATNTGGSTPYIEFKFSAQGLTGKDRIYIIGRCQYCMIAIFSADKGIVSDADKFIRSFKYVK